MFTMCSPSFPINSTNLQASPRHVQGTADQQRLVLRKVGAAAIAARQLVPGS